MNDLRDMGRFPLVIYAGATANVLASITATWFLLGWRNEPWLLWIWAVGLIGLNLTPVVLLRCLDRQLMDTPPIEQMNFFRDQHRFATWVYAVASGNLFFWIVTAGVVHSLSNDPKTLAALLASALVITFFPGWMRLFRA
jgi:hypothetical protein